MPHLLAGSHFPIHVDNELHAKMPHLLAVSCHIHFVVHIDLVLNDPSVGKHLSRCHIICKVHLLFILILLKSLVNCHVHLSAMHSLTNPY